MLTAFLPASSAVCALLARIANPELSHPAALSWPRCTSGPVQPYFARQNKQFRQGNSSRVYSTRNQRGPRGSSSFRAGFAGAAAGKEMFRKMMTQESLGRACGVGAATGLAGAVHRFMFVLSVQTLKCSSTSTRTNTDNNNNNNNIKQALLFARCQVH